MAHFVRWSFQIPEAPNYNRLFVNSPTEKTRTTEGLRAKQRAKRQPSNILGAVDINDDGIVDGVELKLSTYLRSVPVSHGLTARSAYNVRVKEGKKMMVKNFIDEHGFDKVHSFAPQLCGDNVESTIDKLSNSPCFKDDYRFLMIKASSYMSKSTSRPTTANFSYPRKFLHCHHTHTTIIERIGTSRLDIVYFPAVDAIFLCVRAG